MENKTFYQEILLDHNRNPAHKHPLPDADLELEGVNPSCGDDIVLQLKIENGMVADGAFHGNGCAISQASADMMLDLVIGKTKEEAGRLTGIMPSGCCPHARAGKVCGFRLAYPGGIIENRRKGIAERSCFGSFSGLPVYYQS